MEQYQWLDDCFLQQPGTTKEYQPAWQVDRYMLTNKMYAMVGVHEPTGRPMATLKLEPAYSDFLRRQYAGDVIPGYYANKVHWSTVFLDGAVPQDVVREMVAASHKALLATLSKKAQKALLEGGA